MITMKRHILSLILCLVAPLLGSAQNFDPAKFYTIETASGLVLDSKGSTISGTGIFVSTPEAGNPSQVWQIRLQRNGSISWTGPGRCRTGSSH